MCGVGGWGDITQTRNVFVSQLLFLLVFPPFPSPQVQRVSGRKMSRQSHSPSSVNFNASSDKLRQSATRLSNVTHTLITHIKLQEAISSVWKRGGKLPSLLRVLSKLQARTFFSTRPGTTQATLAPGGEVQTARL